jgi:hypothetical protein
VVVVDNSGIGNSETAILALGLRGRSGPCKHWLLKRGLHKQVTKANNPDPFYSLTRFIRFIRWSDCS